MSRNINEQGQRNSVLDLAEHPASFGLLRGHRHDLMIPPEMLKEKHSALKKTLSRGWKDIMFDVSVFK